MSYRLKTLFALVCIVACVTGIVRCHQLPAGDNPEDFTRNLSNSEIVDEAVATGFTHEGVYYVDRIHLSIKGRQDVHIVLAALPDYKGVAMDDPLDVVMIRQLGSWKLRSKSSINQPGIPVYTVLGDCIELGEHGIHSQFVPIEVNSISDVVENYDALAEWFSSSWPKEDSPGEFELERGSMTKRCQFWAEQATAE